MKKLTTEEFIRRAKQIHGDKYDYSKVEYVNNKTKVCIICPIHGEFWQLAQDHASGRGCSKCNGGIQHSNKEWFEKFNKVHGNKYYYNYNIATKLSSNSKIEITCPTHGIFKQSCMMHAIGQGCPKCANETNGINKRSNIEKFIEKARKIHGNKYDYSKVEYINSHTEVCIICSIHGEFWQKPNVHLFNHGCPKCSSSKLELDISSFLDKNNIEYIHQANKKHLEWLERMSLDFYLPQYNIAIECQGGQHFKQVDYFGGDKTFKYTQKQDNRKLKLCNENGVKLLYYSNLGIEYPYKVYENKNDLLKEIING